MSKKRSTPAWQKRLCELGNPQSPHNEFKRRAYLTSTYRYFWGLLAVFLYFLLSAYRLGGSDDSSDDSGIFVLILGSILAGGLFCAKLKRAFIETFSL